MTRRAGDWETRAEDELEIGSWKLGLGNSELPTGNCAQPKSRPGHDLVGDPETLKLGDFETVRLSDLESWDYALLE